MDPQPVDEVRDRSTAAIATVGPALTPSPARAVPTTFPASRAAWAGVVLEAALTAVGVAAVVSGVVLRAPVLVVLGSLLVVMLAPLTWMFLRVARLRAGVTATELRLPRTFRGWRTVPLDRVRAVAVRYHSVGRGSGWRLEVWADASTPLTVPVAVPRRTGAQDSDRVAHRDGRTVPVPDWQRLADTAMGRAALTIARAARSVQGDGGPLARDGGRLARSSDGGSATAFWGVDGEVGEIRRR